MGVMDVLVCLTRVDETFLQHRWLNPVDWITNDVQDEQWIGRGGSQDPINVTPPIMNHGGHSGVHPYIASWV